MTDNPYPITKREEELLRATARMESLGKGLETAHGRVILIESSINAKVRDVEARLVKIDEKLDMIISSLRKLEPRQ